MRFTTTQAYGNSVLRNQILEYGCAMGYFDPWREVPTDTNSENNHQSSIIQQHQPCPFQKDENDADDESSAGISGQDEISILIPYLLSPVSDYDCSMVRTDDLGRMIDGKSVSGDGLGEGGGLDSKREDGVAEVYAVKETKKRTRQRKTVTYVSRHFTDSDGQRVGLKNEDPAIQTVAKMKRGRKKIKKSAEDIIAVVVLERVDSAGQQLETPPTTPQKIPEPRIYYGIDINGWSSDSSLTDVPDDIGPDPFESDGNKIRPTVLVVREKKSRKPALKKQNSSTKSPYFPYPHRHRDTFLSTLPFPPLDIERFGLMQEKLAHDPFRLLIATIFLNKTPGERAMPIFYQLMQKYPTPADLAGAEVADITSIIHKLGFQNQRARKCVAMAQAWVERPPQQGKRYRKLNYPVKGDGRDVKEGEVINEDDPRVAWEISHLPGLGPYSHDSWRMFCRDEMRGHATDWLGTDAKVSKNAPVISETISDKDENSESVPPAEATFEPEWKRVVPTDKELRAYLTWMWMKEGWVWNKETGERIKASDELMERARGGGIVTEEREKNILTLHPLAVEFLPGTATTSGSNDSSTMMSRTEDGSKMETESTDELRVAVQNRKTGDDNIVQARIIDRDTSHPLPRPQKPAGDFIPDGISDDTTSVGQEVTEVDNVARHASSSSVVEGDIQVMKGKRITKRDKPKARIKRRA